jgi:phage gp46-like protein
MGQNARFNPTKRDYDLEKGSVVTTDAITEAAYFVLMIPRGRWLYGTLTQGSELWRFRNAKRTSDTEQLFAARVKEPVNNQLIATGRAKSVVVSSTETTRTGTANEITIEQDASQLASRLNFTAVG